MSSPDSAPSAVAGNKPPPLPGRIGMMLARPARALAIYDVHGGGVRDAAWLVLVGILCFRLEDLVRAVLGLTHLSPRMVLQSLLGTLSGEVREAAVIVLPAALVVTLTAGRTRDPGRDAELGAACYIPFFAVRAIYRTLDLDAFSGPLSVRSNQIWTSAAFVAAVVSLVLAVMVARRRVPTDLASAVVPDLDVSPGTGGRLAAALLAALVGAALFVNADWVVRHVDAIRPLARGHEAPDFSLPRIDGQGGASKPELSLASLKGQVVLLDFWATWCPPCRQMMPTLHDLYGEWHDKGVEFVGINSDGGGSSPADVKRFLEQNPAPYPMTIDSDGEVGSLYKVVALPHMVLVGRDGTIRKAFWGYTSHGELADAIALALR